MLSLFEKSQRNQIKAITIPNSHICGKENGEFSTMAERQSPNLSCSHLKKYILVI